MMLRSIREKLNDRGWIASYGHDELPLDTTSEEESRPRDRCGRVWNERTTNE